MSSNLISGIDVSKWQGQVDWTAVQQAGVVFAFVRATYGASEVDSSFDANWQEMKAAGVIRGAYHFFLAAEDPVQQAEFFVRSVGNLGPDDLPPVVDVESGSGVSSNLVNNLHTWLTTVAQGLGRTPIIYTAPSYWNENLTSGFGLYPLWVAEYGVASPKPVNGWTNWTFWQYSSTGKVNGVKGAVDLDYYDDSSQTLEEFISGSVIAAGAGQ